MNSILLLLFILLSVSTASRHLTSFSISNSPWVPSQNLTLFSPKHTFGAGFRHSPSSASSLYIFAVWVHSSADKTIIWSANPNNPLPPSSSLSITSDGHLILSSSSNPTKNLFPSNPSGLPNTSQLLLHGDGSLNFNNWTSFSCPTDTILPNQPIPFTSTTTLTSSSARFKLVNASVLIFNNSASYWFTDPIRNLTDDGRLATTASNPLVAADVGQTLIRRLTLDDDGNLRIYSLDPNSSRWSAVWQAVLEPCTISGTCGLNEICKPTNGNGPSTTAAVTAACFCPPGFRNSSSGGGCQLKASYPSSGGGSKFLRLDYVDFQNKIDLTPENLDACRSKCIANSSCVAFSYKLTGQRDCYHILHNLTYGYWSPATETSTYIRVATSEPDTANDFTGMTSLVDTTCPVNIGLPIPPKESETTARNVAIISTLFSLELLAGILSFWAFLRRYSKYRDMACTFGLEFLPAGGPRRFSYAEIKAATRDFSDEVGRGGFGTVYKGLLPDGRNVAVKRLRNGVRGRDAEFWSEVNVIARMHHLNLVRMWGFCAEKEQRMLVYEYISNGSLDKFLFQDEQQPHLQPVLDWGIRYRIALGVARAIAYLHEECLEWVLHCDIKPENILLEDDFCPKVSDFGISKLTSKKEMVTMSTLRGTRGYMAPEWWAHRSTPITAKADVYSFGVVLLEMVTGARSCKFQRGSRASEECYLPSWAFEKVYEEGRVEDIVDPTIMGSYDDRNHLPLVERMVKTAMWCLQDQAEARPSMGKVAKMLEGSVEITAPDKPAVFYAAAAEE